MDFDSVFEFCALMKFSIPSKSILYSLLTPRSLEVIENFSFPPFKIISNAFFGMSIILVEREKLYFLLIASICLNIQLFFLFPRGIIPPPAMDLLASGIIFILLISWITPKPLHFLHIPLGELKENVFGSGLSYEIPDSGQIRFLLKYLC